MKNLLNRLSSHLWIIFWLWTISWLWTPVLAEVSVIDDAGQKIVLDNPARRIISLSPHITELLFASGAGEYIVGAVEFSNFPEDAKRIPVLGRYDYLDLEAIVALKPDLIINWKSGNTMGQIQKLYDMGFVIYTSEPGGIDDIASTMEQFGELSGTENIAIKAAKKFREKYSLLKQKYENKKPLRVFYQIWNRPLVTVNGKHLISQVIDLCGGKNIFSDLPTLAPQISIESVLNRNPDVIIASGQHNEQPELLDHWRQWTNMTAVKANNLFFIHPDLMHRHTPRLLQGAEQVCEYLDQARH